MTTLTHPSGERYVVGSSAPDDAERMACRRAGEIGHNSCGTYPCCGWPRFLVCPCTSARYEPSAKDAE